jgi:hypothetical protein
LTGGDSGLARSLSWTEYRMEPYEPFQERAE